MTTLILLRHGRSSANVAAGARTRLSAVLHGVWIAVFALLLAGLVEMIPLAALAGLLVVVGAKLVDRADIRAARDHGELIVYVGTVVGLLLFIVSFVLAAGDLAQVPYVGIVCVTALVAAMGFRFPPTYRTAGR